MYMGYADPFYVLFLGLECYLNYAAFGRTQLHFSKTKLTIIIYV